MLKNYIADDITILNYRGWWLQILIRTPPKGGPTDCNKSYQWNSLFLACPDGKKTTYQYMTTCLKLIDYSLRYS